MPTVTWDDRTLRDSIAVIARKTRQTTAKLLNQIALDVAEDAFDQISPRGDGNNVQAERSRIKAIMDRQIATRIKFFTRGKRKGQIGRAVGRKRELYAKNLIANWWRGREGKKGLYGKAMTRYAGAMSQRRQVGVGSVKSVFIPIFRALLPHVKYKFSYTRKAGRIAVWPGSRGAGVAKLARPGVNPLAILDIRYRARFSQDPKIQRVYTWAVGNAIHSKEARLAKQAEDFMKQDVQQFNAAQH